jgi:hypothetical protein
MKKLLSTAVHFYWLMQIIYAQGFTMEKNDEGAWIKEDGEKVLFFQAKTKSLDGTFPRADYMHPLYNVNGKILTEDFPRDHLHHRGSFLDLAPGIDRGQKNGRCLGMQGFCLGCPAI